LSSLNSKVVVSYEGIDQETLGSYDLENWLGLIEDEIRPVEGAVCSVSLKFLGKEEMRTMNKKFRNKDCPTNVLAFPMNTSLVLETNCLGDLAICPEVVLEEAEEQGKEAANHMAHIFIHGVLHLLGYDHYQEDHTDTMENLERKILSKIGVADPY
tara:strand:+ start:1369 stop:1836 length:468 start_codon:yes stop_codon:yes gene_type:complete